MTPKLDLSNDGPSAHFGKHRCGWHYVIDAMRPLAVPENGVLMDTFIERTHAWHYAQNLASGAIPYKRPWVGFLHNPPNMPRWFDYHNSPQIVLGRAPAKKSLEHCRGIFVLSTPLRTWVRAQFPNIPCHFLFHPTDIPEIRFDMRAYLANPQKRLIQIGYWLRKLHSIMRVPVKKLRKTWIITSDYAKTMRDQVESRTIDPHSFDRSNYEELPFQPEAQYDVLLSRNIAFVEMHDCAACNAVIECIARNTPLLINQLPAVVEYLGHSYPFYYRDMADAARKAEDVGRVRAAHEYLAAMDKGFLSPDRFRRDLHDSPIYQSL